MDLGLRASEAEWVISQMRTWGYPGPSSYNALTPSLERVFATNIYLPTWAGRYGGKGEKLSAIEYGLFRHWQVLEITSSYRGWETTKAISLRALLAACSEP